MGSNPPARPCSGASTGEWLAVTAEKKSRKKSYEPSETSGFMSRRQVSEQFGFSLSYLAHLPLDALPHYKVGGKVLYERTEVVAFIKGQRPVIGKPTPTNRRRGRPSKPVIAERGQRAEARAEGLQ